MDDFSKKSAHLKHLSEQELKTYFFKLLEEITDPIYQMAKKYTSPSIERSVLLRMGFSSLEAQAIVNYALREELLGHGVGNLILRYASISGLPYREAGLKLSNDEGWSELKALWSKNQGLERKGV